MPRSLLGRLIAILALLAAAAIASGFLMVSLFEQSAAARVAQADAVAAQSCSSVVRSTVAAMADRTGPEPDLDEPALRRDLTAAVVAALRDVPGVEGGLWQAEAGSLAYGFPTYEGSQAKTDVPRAELPRIRAAAAAALARPGPLTARFDARAQTLIVASCPLPGPIPRSSAWTMTRVHSFAGTTYIQLMAGLAILSAAVVGASVLAALLVRTWMGHVGRIEAAFAAAEGDDLPYIPATGERELDRVLSAMNVASRRLAQARQQTAALSRQVTESDRLAAVGRVAAGVAHEIRNPIAAMRLKAESALRGGDERKLQALTLVIAQVDRLDLLVRRLLNVAERDAPAMAETALAPFLASCAATHRAAAAERGGDVTVVCAGGSAGFDPAQIRRALDNLVANAIEAGGAGEVTLTAGRVEDRLVFAVSDRGPGPPAAIRDTLFEPFVTGRPDGAGLGLSIVREIARAHGGTAHHDRAEAATTFRIEIPWPTS